MQISPKAQIIISVVVALLALAAKGTVALPMGVPPDWGQYITSWAGFLITIYLCVAPFLPAFSSSAPGPLAPQDTPAVKQAMIASGMVKALILFAVLCLVALHVAPAVADPDSAPLRPAPVQLHLPKAPFTGAIAKDVSTAATAIAGDASDQSTGNVLTHILVPDLIADLTAAQAVYVALKDDAGAACNQSILTQIQAFQGAVANNPLPKVHLAYDFAVIRSLLLGIQPNSPIYNNCATIAAQTGQTVIQLVTGIITGATSVLPTIAALGQ